MPNPVRNAGRLRVLRGRQREGRALCAPLLWLSWLLALAGAPSLSIVALQTRGTAQLDLTNETGFTARAASTATYDVLRGRTVVFGGSASDRAVWERTQTGWERIEVTESPDPRPWRCDGLRRAIWSLPVFERIVGRRLLAVEWDRLDSLDDVQ